MGGPSVYKIRQNGSKGMKDQNRKKSLLECAEKIAHSLYPFHKEKKTNMREDIVSM